MNIWMNGWKNEFKSVDKTLDNWSNKQRATWRFAEGTSPLGQGLDTHDVMWKFYLVTEIIWLIKTFVLVIVKVRRPSNWHFPLSTHTTVNLELNSCCLQQINDVQWGLTLERNRAQSSLVMSCLQILGTTRKCHHLCNHRWSWAVITSSSSLLERLAAAAAAQHPLWSVQLVQNWMEHVHICKVLARLTGEAFLASPSTYPCNKAKTRHRMSSGRSSLSIVWYEAQIPGIRYLGFPGNPQTNVEA